MNLKQLIKKEVSRRGGKIPKSKKRLLGKALMVYAALPLMSAWAFIPGLILSMPMSFSMWSKDKIRYLNEWRMLK